MILGQSNFLESSSQQFFSISAFTIHFCDIPIDQKLQKDEVLRKRKIKIIIINNLRIYRRFQKKFRHTFTFPLLSLSNNTIFEKV
jgi:hypothetical protein